MYNSYNTDEEIPLDVLRKKYLGNARRPKNSYGSSYRPTSSYQGSTARRTGIMAICDLLFFITGILVAILTIFSFARESSVMDDYASLGNNLNVFAFLFGENSMVERLIEGTFSPLQAFAYIFFLADSITLSVKLIINAVKSTTNFFRRKFDELHKSVVSSIMQILSMLLVFNFLKGFQNTYSYDYDYMYSGYAPGSGMMAAVYIGFSVIFAVSIISFFANSRNIIVSQKRRICHLLCTVGTLLCVVFVINMNIYPTLQYFFDTFPAFGGEDMTFATVLAVVVMILYYETGKIARNHLNSNLSGLLLCVSSSGSESDTRVQVYSISCPRKYGKLIACTLIGIFATAIILSMDVLFEDVGLSIMTSFLYVLIAIIAIKIITKIARR